MPMSMGNLNGDEFCLYIYLFSIFSFAVYNPPLLPEWESRNEDWYMNILFLIFFRYSHDRFNL